MQYHASYGTLNRVTLAYHTLPLHLTLSFTNSIRFLLLVHSHHPLVSLKGLTIRHPTQRISKTSMMNPISIMNIVCSIVIVLILVHTPLSLASGHGSHLGGKIVLLLLDPLSNGNSRESNHFRSILFQ